MENELRSKYDAMMTEFDCIIVCRRRRRLSYFLFGTRPRASVSMQQGVSFTGPSWQKPLRKVKLGVPGTFLKTGAGWVETFAETRSRLVRQSFRTSFQNAGPSCHYVSTMFPLPRFESQTRCGNSCSESRTKSGSLCFGEPPNVHSMDLNTCFRAVPIVACVM